MTHPYALPHPRRLRLNGGRNTHAAREITINKGDILITACGMWFTARSERKPDTAAVTCPACIRNLARHRSEAPRL